MGSILFSDFLHETGITSEYQGLQVFAFCVVTVTDEHTRPRFKRNLIEVKFKDGICTELSCGFKATGIFVIFANLDGFESDS